MFILFLLGVFVASEIIVAEANETDSKPRQSAGTSQLSCSPTSSSSLLSCSSFPSDVWTDDRPGHISKLNDDCLNEKFGYLPLKDLVSIGRTNKALNRAAADFYRKNFYGRVRGKGGNIYAENSEIKLNCFSKFVQSIFMEDGDMSLFQPNRFDSLKEIELYDDKLTSIESIQNVLPSTETLKFLFCTFDGDIDELFLSHSPNLKRLYVRDADEYGRGNNVSIIGPSNDWLKKRYPSLEHFEINSRRKIPEVIEFLQNNKNIRKFSTTMDFLIVNRAWLIQSNIKLDVLSILHANTDINRVKNDLYFFELTELRERGFFKDLHLYFGTLVWDLIYPFDLSQYVKVFHVTNDPYQYELSSLNNLEKFYLLGTSQLPDVGAIIPMLQNLEYVYFRRDFIGNILPFINSLHKLNTLQIEFVWNYEHPILKENVLDLEALNEERAKLTNTCKLTMYVPENVFLTTKTARNQTIFGLIEIKRFEAYDGVQDFASTPTGSLIAWTRARRSCLIF